MQPIGTESLPGVKKSRLLFKTKLILVNNYFFFLWGNVYKILLPINEE